MASVLLCDFFFGEAVQLVDEGVYLPVCGVNLAFNGGFFIRGFGVCVLCPDDGLEWYGLIASVVEQKAFMRALSCLAPSDIYHPRGSWLHSNPLITRGSPANLLLLCNSGPRSARPTSASYLHLSTPSRRLFTPKFPVGSGNFGIVAEYSIGLSFAVRSFSSAAYPVVYYCLFRFSGLPCSLLLRTPTIK